MFLDEQSEGGHGQLPVESTAGESPIDARALDRYEKARWRSLRLVLIGRAGVGLDGVLTWSLYKLRSWYI